MRSQSNTSKQCFQWWLRQTRFLLVCIRQGCFSSLLSKTFCWIQGILVPLPTGIVLKEHLRGDYTVEIQPKLHFFGEILHPLEVQQRENRPSINPLAWGTQADEDFVGTISSFSRMVSVRTVHERTIQRYQVGLAMRW